MPVRENEGCGGESSVWETRGNSVEERGKKGQTKFHYDGQEPEFPSWTDLPQYSSCAQELTRSSSRRDTSPDMITGWISECSSWSYWPIIFLTKEIWETHCVDWCKVLEASSSTLPHHTYSLCKYIPYRHVFHASSLYSPNRLLYLYIL